MNIGTGVADLTCSVTPISTATGKAGPAIRTGKTPFAIAITL